MPLSEMHLVLIKQPTVLLNSTRSFTAQDFLATRFTMAFSPEKGTLGLRSSLQLNGSPWEKQAHKKLKDNLSGYSFRSTIDLRNAAPDDIYPEKTILSPVVFKEEKAVLNNDHLLVSMRDNMLMMSMTRTIRAFQDKLLSHDVAWPEQNVRLKHIYRPSCAADTDDSGMWQEFFNPVDWDRKQLAKPGNAGPLYLEMVTTLCRQVNDRDNNLIARVTYHSDDFTREKNPFYDFMTDLQQPEHKPQDSMARLVTQLQSYCA